MSCSDCFAGSVHEGNPRGKIIKLHGLDTYVTEPADGRSVKGIIVIIPDAFGWDFVNNRILADHYADKGDYRVYLPDFMNGTAASPLLIESLKVITNGGYLAKLSKLPWTAYSFGKFFMYNRFGRSYPPIKAFMLALRQNEAAAGSLPIGVAGFCWGGKHLLMLAADGEKDAASGKPLFDAGFTGHPSALSIPSDIEKAALPISFAIGEQDMATSVPNAEKIKAIVEKKPAGQKGELVLYKGCGHGFCVRADTTLDDIAKQATEAENQCVRWFNNHFGFSG